MVATLPYEYKNLDEKTASIRLLALEPSLHEDDDVKCSLQHVEIAQAGSFEALSYVWGEASATTRESIIVEGCEFSVTANLWHALRNIRPKLTTTGTDDRSKGRTLWVDAICINQDDILERNSQVQMMRMIYRRAQRVLIFLSGIETQLSTLECHALMHKIHQLLVQRSPILGSGKRPYVLRTPIREAKVLMSELPSQNSSGWDQLAQMFAQSWFNRVWVIQEVSEAAEAVVIHGGIFIDWFIVEVVAEWTISVRAPELQRKFSTRGIINANFMGQKEFKLLPGDHILELFHRVRDFDATDPRDKVFAMLSHPVERVLSIGHVAKSKPAAFAFLVWITVLVALMLISGRHPDMNTVYYTLPILFSPVSLWPKVQAMTITFVGCLTSAITLTAMSSNIPKDMSIGYMSLSSVLFPIILWLGNFCILFAIYGVVMEDSFESLVSISTPRRETVGQLLGIKVDYALSAMQIFDALNDAAMDYHQDLRSLSYVLHTPNVPVSDDRPSWSPQWDHGTTRIANLTTWNFNKKIYKANTGTPSAMKYTRREGHCLILQGLQIDTVVAPISDLLIPNDFIASQQGTSKTLNRILNSHNQDLNDRIYPPTGEPLSSAILQTLITDRNEKGNRTGKAKFYSSTLLYLMQQTELWPPAFNSVAVNACVMKRFFRTEGGYVGIGPQAMLAGDVVVVLFGAEVPFVLRRVEDSNIKNRKKKKVPVWRLVGQAYVHGVMDGEALKMWKAGVLRKEEFLLR